MRLSRRVLASRHSKAAHRARVLRWAMSAGLACMLMVWAMWYRTVVSTLVDPDMLSQRQEAPRTDDGLADGERNAHDLLEDALNIGQSLGVHGPADGSAAADTDSSAGTGAAPADVPAVAADVEAHGTGDRDIGAMYRMHIDQSAYCVLPGACRLFDGKLSLPRWLEAHAEALHSCGAADKGVIYYDSPPAPVREAELFGTSVLRYHFPHFMQDAFHLVTLFNVAFNATGAHVTASNCVQHDGGGCSGQAPPGSGWNPVVLLEDRVKTQPIEGWVHQFLRLLPPKEYPGPAHGYVGEAYPAGESSPPRCFRSIVTGRASMRSLTLPPALASDGNVLFAPNNIAKTPRSECPLQVAVLNRVEPNGYTSGRFFSEADALMHSLRSELDKSGLSFDLQLITFNDASFGDQVRAMNKLDLVISVHGAELTNVVWMRPGAKVIEVMPFQYQTEIFVDMARFVGVEVEQIIAKPDVSRFESCLRVYNEKYGMEGSLAAIEAFRSAGEHFLATGKVELIDTKMENVKMLTACLRAQALVVDNKFVAHRAATKLGFRCVM